MSPTPTPLLHPEKTQIILFHAPIGTRAGPRFGGLDHNSILQLAITSADFSDRNLAILAGSLLHTINPSNVLTLHHN